MYIIYCNYIGMMFVLFIHVNIYYILVMLYSVGTKINFNKTSIQSDGTLISPSNGDSEDGQSDHSSVCTVFSDCDNKETDSADGNMPSVTLTGMRLLDENQQRLNNFISAGEEHVQPEDGAQSLENVQGHQEQLGFYDVDMLAIERRSQLIKACQCPCGDVGVSEAELHPDLIVEAILHSQHATATSNNPPSVDQNIPTESVASVKLRPDASWINGMSSEDWERGKESFNKYTKDMRNDDDLLVDNLECPEGGRLEHCALAKANIIAAKQQWIQMEQKTKDGSSSSVMKEALLEDEYNRRTSYNAEDLILEPGLVLKTKLQLESMERLVITF